MRFSTTPFSLTMTTITRPGPKLTNSMWRNGLSDLGAMTRLAQRDRPESAAVASSSNVSRLLSVPAHWLSMASRSSSVRLPTSSNPSTKRRSPTSVGRRPADLWGA